MSQLKQFDDTVFDEDEYETPPQLYNELCYKTGIKPKLDVAANTSNRKCLEYLKDGLHESWNKDVWCNPPHSITEKFVRKACEQWHKNNINILMIIPTNTMSSSFWHECIEPYAEYFAIRGRIRFLRFGHPAKHASRNAYVCVIWRKR